MPLFSCLDHFLDVRAEILQIFRVKFWKILETKNSFWNYWPFGQSTFSRIFEPQVFWKKYIPIWRVFLHKTFKFVFEMIIVQMMVHFGSGICVFSTNLTLNQIIFMSFYMIIELVYPSKTKITMMTFVRLVLRMKFNTMSFK